MLSVRNEAVAVAKTWSSCDVVSLCSVDALGKAESWSSFANSCASLGIETSRTNRSHHWC